VIIDVDDYIAHYGTPRHSGRYPWGSGGEDGANRNRDFLQYVAGLKRQGMTEAEIARGLGLDSTTRLRAAKSIAKNAQKQADIFQAQRLKDKGLSNVAIGERMGINESSVRALLAPGQKDKADVLEATSNMLKDQVEKKKYIDIGSGVEYHMGVSRTKLNTAVAVLQEEGYKVHYLKVEQLGTGKQTTMKVLTAPDVPYSEVFKNRDNVQQITDYSQDGGRTFLGIKPPTSVSSKRVGVTYGEEGKKADGVIYVRPGAKDLSLGESHYAQVRIAVDGTHYLKGMAMYKDDLPDGVDLMFNTNKENTGNKLDAFKKLKDDPDNPFGAVISRQSGHVNIVNEEGNWSNWSKSLSSQMLSKQSPSLARTQLDMTYSKKKSEFDEINKLTNPSVKKRLLESFADDADSSAVHLKAAALPRQGSHVILPIESMSANQIYAPNYRDGERVALIRYPHGGKFEIPELVVNNRQPEAKKLLGNATDAVGISHKVAERLSGADFDGDTVLVIPNNSGRVKSEPALEGLKNFDPMKYKLPADAPKMSPRTKQVEMGKVSNLITDMTIRGANNAELARAVRHSMVVIDAEKHHLDYKESARVNNIPQLKAKYQGSARGGASTLISNSGASSTIKVPEFKPRSAKDGGPIDKATGEKVFVKTGSTYTDKTGHVVPHLTEVTKLGYTKDAHTLSSGTPIEKIYADHSNRLKSLANEARKSMVNTKTTPYSPSAKTAYSNEVGSLNAKLNLALRNAPLERQAQVLANATYSAKKRANPDMDPAETKKIKAQALAESRARTGAKKAQIQITDNEWAAIQAGAISTNKLSQILQNADLDQVKKLATPKSELLMSSAKANRAKAMLASGYTQAEVADALGVSVTTLKKGLSGE
jgi:DNA-binding CsgD family transcriptional regulator